MKKLFIDKNDEPSTIIEKVLGTPDEELVLVIPRNSKLKGSLANFHQLKKDVEEHDKSVLLESVDEDVLAAAKAAGIEAMHPLLRGAQTRSPLSDIVHPDVATEPEKKLSASSKKEAAAKEIEKAKVTIEPPSNASPMTSTVSMPGHDAVARPAASEASSGDKDDDDDNDEEPRPARRGRRVVWAVAVAIPLCAAAAAIVMAMFFGHADVTLNFKKTPWVWKQAISADKSVAALDVKNFVIPGEVFTQQKNLTQSFPATNKKTQVSEKSTGKIKIVNEFGAEPQILVATTRFQAADGKIFRLVNRVTVPGAKTSGGAITPSSIEADVIADQPGPDYNRSAAEKLSIPGFAGTPRAEKFYGTMISTAGGFVGEHSVPTDEEVEQAKQKIQAVLTDTFKSNELNNRPADLIILDGASQLNISKITVNRLTDDQGNFTVFAEGSFRAVAFREADARALINAALNAEMGQEGKPLKITNDKITYEQPVPNFDQGKLQMQLAVSGEAVPDFNIDGYKANVAGKSVKEVRAITAGLFDLTNAKISVWPFWLRSVPAETGKVSVKVE